MGPVQGAFRKEFVGIPGLTSAGEGEFGQEKGRFHLDNAVYYILVY